MKTVLVEKAIGMVLGHDVTEIVPGVFKGVAFKRGHVICEEDITKLRSIGKENIYVMDIEGRIHEDDAAKRLAEAASGDNIKFSGPSEGKISLSARISGLLKVNKEALYSLNEINDIIFSTIHTNQRVIANQTFAGTRIIPLSTKKENLEKAEDICRKNFPVIEIKTFIPLKAAVITTGNEIYHGRIEDKFGSVAKKKIEEYGSILSGQIFVPDDVSMTVDAILKSVKEGAQLILVTGGMSVDPDDRTPASIVAAGGKVVSYGAPVLPGAMFMLAYIGKIPVIGLPACVIYYKTTIFDLILPRLLAGETITKKDISSMGHGGFCSTCNKCVYPLCRFGK